jgi:HSP20 family molecular chaperone IbpA
MKKAGRRGDPSVRETGFPHTLSVEGNDIRITAELPGISEEMIRLDLDDKVLTISVNGGNPRFRKAIVLPWEARLGKKLFRKGVLDLTLEKPA